MLWRPGGNRQYTDDFDRNHDSVPRLNGCALGVLLGAGLWTLFFLLIWLVRTL